MGMMSACTVKKKRSRTFQLAHLRCLGSVLWGVFVCWQWGGSAERLCHCSPEELGMGMMSACTVKKKKMTYLSTCPFEVPRLSLVGRVHMLAVGREHGASSLLQSWGVGGHGNDERTAQFKKKKSRTF